GWVIRCGLFRRAYSFDTAGPLTHSVADAAILLQHMAEYDPEDEYAVQAPTSDFTAELNSGVSGLRLGVVEDFTYRNVDSEIASAVQVSVDLLGKMGAVIKTVKIPLFVGKIDFKYPLRFYSMSLIRSSAIRIALRTIRRCLDQLCTRISRKQRGSVRIHTKLQSKNGRTK